MARKQTIFEVIRSGEAAKVRRKLAREPEAVNERDAEGLSPLMRALYADKPEIVGALAERGVPIDVHEAAALGQIDALKTQLGRSRKKANAYSPDGFTPLHLAAYFGRVEAAELLIDRGADLHARSQNRHIPSVMPLHSAIAGGKTEVALLLLERGADPNATAAGGWVPLHWAASSGNLEICRALLKRRAKRMPMADDRTRPLDLAIENGHAEVVRLLRGRR